MDLPLINLHTCTVVDTNANFPFFPFMFILAIHPFVMHLQRNRLIDMIQSITSLQINKAFQQNNNTNVKSKVNKFIKKNKQNKQTKQTNKQIQKLFHGIFNMVPTNSDPSNGPHLSFLKPNTYIYLNLLLSYSNRHKF